MNDMLEEEVFPVPPMSVRVLERLGEETLALLNPDALSVPTAIDVLELVDHGLARHGIDVFPVTGGELRNREGATDIDDETGRTMILLLETVWDDLLAGGRRSHRARATVIHEVAHAVLHVRHLKRWKAAPRQELMLNRVRRREIKAFEDPEWQAWTLAGCILMPRKTLAQITPCAVDNIADIYGVSERMVRTHLHRLKLDAWRR